MNKKLSAFLMIMASTWAHAEIQLENKAFKVVTITSNNGAQTEQWQTPDKMLPGDKVGYQINFSNPDQEAANNIVIANPIPDNTVYVSGSAKGTNTAISFSVDDGKTYAQPEQLFVEKDGQRVQADAADYSHVRWQFNQPLAAGADGSVQYEVIIK